MLMQCKVLRYYLRFQYSLDVQHVMASFVHSHNRKVQCQCYISWVFKDFDRKIGEDLIDRIHCEYMINAFTADYEI